MEKDRKGIKLSYNKKALYALILILALIGISVALKVTLKILEKDKGICVLQQTTCCSCSMGGKQECMTADEAKIMQEKLAKECKKDMMCIAMFNCENITCVYKDEKCQKS